MKKLFLIMAIIFSVSTLADLPKNDLTRPIDNTIMQTTETEFNKAIDDVELHYKVLIKEKYNGTLAIERKWSDDTVNAYARRSGSTWHIAMFGGLARHELVTADGFRAVICHELGHHMGGAPKGGWFNRWASIEGQSDYFSTAKCLKNIFLTDPETYLIYNQGKNAEEQYAADECDKIFKTHTPETMACYRATRAGISLAQLLNTLSEGAPVSLLTPSDIVVDSMLTSHPPAQCRLDTYFAGALCDKSPTELPNQSDRHTGYCMRADNYVESIRPLCWYLP